AVAVPVDTGAGVPVPVVPVAGFRSVAFPVVSVSAAWGFSLHANISTMSRTAIRRMEKGSFQADSAGKTHARRWAIILTSIAAVRIASTYTTFSETIDEPA